MRRLPPLTAIEAFVQVARLGSIKAAAEELALSSPALSRRVQALERFLGKQLFERRHQALRLNSDGERLIQRLSPALDTLSEAIDEAASNGVLRLRLSVLPLFASQQLMPHLAQLRAQHPDLHLDVDTAAHGAARLGEDIDAAIILAATIDPALYARQLGQNQVVLIGARDLRVDGEPVTRPAQLSRLTALIHRDMPDTFEAWRAAHDLEALEPLAVDHFDSGQLMLEAAAAGLGVAFMLDSHLAGAHDPRLVQLFDDTAASPYQYWFVCRPRALETKPVALFHDWLVKLF